MATKTKKKISGAERWMRGLVDRRKKAKKRKKKPLTPYQKDVIDFLRWLLENRRKPAKKVFGRLAKELKDSLVEIKK